MDEAGWLTCRDLNQLVTHLCDDRGANRTKAGRRKLRLFSCACARHLWHQLDHRCKALVEGVERLADGGGSAEEVARLAHEATSPGGEVVHSPSYGLVWSLTTDSHLRYTALNAAMTSTGWLVQARNAELRQAGRDPVELAALLPQLYADEGARHADLIREIFGNPFRPPAKRKFPADVRGLAQACHEDQAHYPLLADALADLGEDAAAEHCRLPGHVKGCHVADWVLGKA